MARTNFDVTQYATYQRTYKNSGSEPYVTDGGTLRSYTKTGFRSSVGTPGFTHLKGKVRLTPNPFEFQLVEHWMPTGVIHRSTPQYKPWEYPFYYLDVIGAQDSNPPFYGYSASTGPSFTLRSRVTNDLLGKIKSQKANLPELMAEREKTARMVGDVAMTIVGVFGDLRKGDIVSAAKRLGVPPRRRGVARFNKAFAQRKANAVANGWLQLQYGWKPLLSDIYGSCEVLANMGLEPLYVTTKSKKKEKQLIADVQRTYDGGIFSNHYTESRIIGKLETTFQQSVTYYKPPSPVHQLKELGITNSALLIWELLPYSFVADWILPIGAWLGSFDATLGLEFHSGYETVFSKFAATHAKSVQGTSNYGYVDDWHIESKTNQVYCKRTPLGGFPSPVLPAFKNPVSITHMANGIALLTQLFRK